MSMVGVACVERRGARPSENPPLASHAVPAAGLLRGGARSACGVEGQSEGVLRVSEATQ